MGGQQWSLQPSLVMLHDPNIKNAFAIVSERRYISAGHGFSQHAEPPVSLESFMWAHCLVSSRALDFVLRMDTDCNAATKTAQQRSGSPPSMQDGVQRLQCMLPGKSCGCASAPPS